jgi:hypothetical protein
MKTRAEEQRHQRRTIEDRDGRRGKRGALRYTKARGVGGSALE